MEYKYTERKRWGFLGLPFTFTVYKISDDMITIDRGFFNKVEDDCYLYKVQDVKLLRSFTERLFGIGTVMCYTSDVTTQTIELKHIKNSKEVKDYIFKQAEETRLKRRTVNMQNIGVDAQAIMDADGDGIPDDVFN